MLALILGVALVLLGVLALVRDVLDLYLVVGVALILVGAWVLAGAREVVRR